MKDKANKLVLIKHYMIPIIMSIFACVFLVNQILLPSEVPQVKQENLSRHVNELTSKKYAGRQVGTQENNLAMEYITDFFQANNIGYGVNNQSYLQPFQSVVPFYSNQSTFTVFSQKETIHLNIFKDFNLYAHTNGKGLQHKGRMIFTGTELYNIDPSYIENSIIVATKGFITSEDVEFVQKHNGKGLFVVQMSGMMAFSAQSELLPQTKSLSTFAKSDHLLPIGHFNKDAYFQLLNYADEKQPIKSSRSEMYVFNHVEANSDISFPIVDTANVIGKIQGKNKNGKHLIVSTNLDGLGEGSNNHYFPSASKNATGIAVLLEIAKNLSSKNNLPYETIYFVFWNGESSDLAGSSYYLNHPVAPLENAMHIQIDQIGSPSSDQAKIYSRTDLGKMLRSMLLQYTEDQGEPIVSSDTQINSSQLTFTTYDVPSVTIHNSQFLTDTYADTASSINYSEVQSAANVLQSYITHEIYQENNMSYVPLGAKVAISLLFVLALFIQLVISIYNHVPSQRLWGKSIEQFYFSSWFTFLKRSFFTFTIAITLLLIIVFIGFLPEDTSIFHRGKYYYSNISVHLMIKKTLSYIINLFNAGFGETLNHASVWSIISKASLRSFVLIFFSLCISFVLGLFKGTFDHYKLSKRNHSPLSMIFTASIPDVLVVLLGILLVIFSTKYQIPFLNHPLFKKQGVPLLCLTILPYLYVSKTTYIFVKDELDKMYILNAKAKGLSRMEIFTKHLLPTAFYKNIDMIPTLFALIISNLIIVEYLFDYKGIIYFLIYFQQLGDSYTFIGLSIALALIYILINTLSKLLAHFINPMKKEGI